MNTGIMPAPVKAALLMAPDINDAIAAAAFVFDLYNIMISDRSFLVIEQRCTDSNLASRNSRAYGNDTAVAVVPSCRGQYPFGAHRPLRAVFMFLRRFSGPRWVRTRKTVVPAPDPVPGVHHRDSLYDDRFLKP